MNEFLSQSVFFGSALTFITFMIGRFIYKKTNFFLFSPLIVSVTCCILFLIYFDIDYDSYTKGADLISDFLTPATICLAVPLYLQFEQLKKNWLPVFLGILSGVITNLGLIYILCILFKIGHVEYISLLPKSLTTAIAFSLTEQYSGIVPITAVMVIIAGNIGNLFAVQICKIVRITEPVAVGVAIGTCSHALGTSKAIDIGDGEGAISGLSIAITGLLTVLIFPLFANLI